MPVNAGAGLKRTIKLRQADTQGREFIRVQATNKTDWASCNMKYQKPQFPTELRMPTGGGDPQKFLLAIFAAFFSVPIFTFALTSIAAQTGEVVLVTAYTKAGEFAGFRRRDNRKPQRIDHRRSERIDLLSGSIKQPKFPNFNRPCDPVGQGKF